MNNPYIAILGIVLVTVFGDWALKIASMQKEWANRHLLLGMGLYMMSGLGFVIAMRHMSLATVGVWYAVLTVLMMTALGFFVFDEKLMPRDIAGIFFAIVALVLMARFA